MENLEEALKLFRFKMKLEKRWSDIDEMGHVNNAIYLTYFEQSRVSYFNEYMKWNWQEYGVILANSHVDYIRPLLYPEPTFIYTRISRLGGKSFEVQYLIVNEKEGEKVLVAKGYTTLVMFDYKTKSSFIVPNTIREKVAEYEPALGK